MPTLKEQAETLRIALRAGVISKEAVIAWADEQIMADPNLAYALVEVSLGSRLPVDELAACLTEVGLADEAATQRAYENVLGAIGAYFRAHSAATDPVVQVVYRVAGYGGPEEHYYRASRWDDTMALIVEESFALGTEESVAEEVRSLLNCFNDPMNLAPLLQVPPPRTPEPPVTQPRYPVVRPRPSDPKRPRGCLAVLWPF